MRRLTLILSDLYLPAEASSDGMPDGAVALPNLDALLRFSSAPIGIEDWRSWLAIHLKVSEFAHRPVAVVAACNLLSPALAANAWLATPVRLEARLDHVRLMDRGLLRIAPAERDVLIEEFARNFGPQYALHGAGERGFLLSGLPAVRLDTTDPARLLDADISNGIPKSGEARELRRLASEIDMWMHGSALNESRERIGAPRISSLWLWGGGVTAGGNATPCAPDATLVIHGSDPWLAGIARCVGAGPLVEAPVAFPSLATRDHTVVELAPMSGAAHHDLATLDAQWFGPVRGALARGHLAQVHLVANDRVFRVSAHSSWRLWRRKRSWLSRLKARPLHAKA